MASLNKVMIMGNLTRDPEVRYTPKGQAVVDIGLAVNRRYKVENETREEVTFIDVTFWGRSAEIIGQYMKKGRPLYVEGRLQLDSWEDKATGQKKSRLKVIGDEFQFLGGRDGAPGGGGSPDDDDAPAPPRSSRPPQQNSQRSSGNSAPASRPPQDYPAGLDDEDEIPF
ncbi:MAG: single-strand DNA-binding protein [Verrucomicrobia bacterium]|jgi:single-strand DNA-binding protein|nr:MAG: single-strand DNA-binding protein [Verrucomicrobiota bacterium]